MSHPDDRPLPQGVEVLVWCGVIPFAAARIVPFIEPSLRSFALAAFIAYGAVILSFLGGARWGRGFAAGEGALRFVEAVVPSLIGFLALLLWLRSSIALALLVAGFLIWLVVDLRDPLWSPAYRRLRFGVSAIVVMLHASWLIG